MKVGQGSPQPGMLQAPALSSGNGEEPSWVVATDVPIWCSKQATSVVQTAYTGIYTGPVPSVCAATDVRWEGICVGVFRTLS